MHILKLKKKIITKLNVATKAHIRKDAGTVKEINAFKERPTLHQNKGW